MPSRDRHIFRADRLERSLRERAGHALRTARLIAGLTQSQVATALGCSHTEIGRVELGRAPWVTIGFLCRFASIVGLDVSIRLYPGAPALRDHRHAAHLAALASLAHPSLKVLTEVPLPRPGDQRAWDAMVRKGSDRAAIEVETEIHDAQALERRLALKQRDGEVGVVVLVIADTKRNRAAVRDGWGSLGPRFPARAAAIRGDLAAGRVPAQSGVVWLSVPRASRSRA